MMKRNISIAVLALLALLSVTSISASAREIGQLSNFYVHYQTTDVGEKYTEYLLKAVTNRDAVINLKDDSGSAWITGILRNSEGAARGSVALQRGERRTFQSTGTANYKYRLGLRKTYNTDGSYAYINGSWSPDAY